MRTFKPKTSNCLYVEPNCTMHVFLVALELLWDLVKHVEARCSSQLFWCWPYYFGIYDCSRNWSQVRLLGAGFCKCDKHAGFGGWIACTLPIWGRWPFSFRLFAAAATRSGRMGFLALARTKRFWLGARRAVYKTVPPRRALLGHGHAGSSR